MLEVARLTCGYGDVIIVDDLSFPMTSPEFHGAHPGEQAA